MAAFTPIKCFVKGCDGTLQYTGRMTDKKSKEPRKHIFRCSKCGEERED